MATVAEMEANKENDLLRVPQWSIMPSPKKNSTGNISSHNNSSAIDPSFSMTEESIESDVLRVRDLDALNTPRRAGGILRASDTPGTGQSVRFGMRLYDDGDESKFSVSNSAINSRGDDSLNLPTLGGYSNLHDESFGSQRPGRLGMRSLNATSSHDDSAKPEESFDESFLRAEVARAKRAMMAEDEDGGDQSDFQTAPSSRPSPWGTPKSILSGDGSILLPSSAEQNAVDAEKESSDEKETDQDLAGGEASLISAKPMDIDADEEVVIYQAIESLDIAHAERANMLLRELKRAQSQVHSLQEEARSNDGETRKLRAVAVQEKESFATRMQEMKDLVDKLQAQLARRNRPGLDTTSEQLPVDERLLRVEAEREALQQELDLQAQELTEVKLDLARATEQVEFDANEKTRMDKEALEQEVFRRDEQLFAMRNEVDELKERLSGVEERANRDEEGFHQELGAKDFALSEAQQEAARLEESHKLDIEQLQAESAAQLQTLQNERDAARQELDEVREALAHSEQSRRATTDELHAIEQQLEHAADQQTLAIAAAAAVDRKSQNRITALEYEVRDRGVKIVKLQKTVKRQEDDLLNYGIALASKQQEIKLLKRNNAAGRKTQRSSTAAANSSTTTAGVAEGMSTLAC